jgi:predicted aspartyl protease
MGVTYATIKVKRFLSDEEPIELRVKVDTGATMLVIPWWVQERFSFPIIRKQSVKYADERREQRDVAAGVEIEVCCRKGVFSAVVEPKKEYGLLGAIVMEELDLIVEPRELKLYPNPRSPDIPMAEIE